MPALSRHHHRARSVRSRIASRFAGALLAALLWCPAQSALAQEWLYGSFGGDQIFVFAAQLGWAPWWSTALEEDRTLSLHGLATLSGWYAHGKDLNKSLIAFGAYPVLRLDMAPMAGFVPYMELAIGVNALTHTWIENRRLSTAFQFGEFGGLGVTFGDKRQFDLGARYQHISNADIKRPNDGLSYASIYFGYRFGSP